MVSIQRSNKVNENRQNIIRSDEGLIELAFSLMGQGVDETSLCADFSSTSKTTSVSREDERRTDGRETDLHSSSFTDLIYTQTHTVKDDFEASS